MSKIQLHRLVETAAQQGRNCPLIVTKDMVEDIYDSVNRAVFNGILERPKLVVRNYATREIWGECEGWQRGSRWGAHYTVVIRIQKHFPNLKKLIAVVAHEMVHQWEWDKCGVMTHGRATFFAWEDRLRSKGIRLAAVG